MAARSSLRGSTASPGEVDARRRAPSGETPAFPAGRRRPHFGLRSGVAKPGTRRRRFPGVRRAGRGDAPDRGSSGSGRERPVGPEGVSSGGRGASLALSDALAGCGPAVGSAFGRLQVRHPCSPNAAWRITGFSRGAAAARRSSSRRSRGDDNAVSEGLASARPASAGPRRLASAPSVSGGAGGLMADLGPAPWSRASTFRIARDGRKGAITASGIGDEPGVLRRPPDRLRSASRGLRDA